MSQRSTDSGQGWSAVRRRYVRTSAWVVPAVAVLGAVVGYLSSGVTAAVVLAVFFAAALALILGVQYLIVAHRRR